MQLKDSNEMVKVLTTLTVINRADQIRAEDGTISPEQVRSITLNNVLVDTGATTLCLPTDAITKLGLKLLKEVDVTIAMGIGKARIFRDATICLCGREGTFECLELPGGNDALKAVKPLILGYRGGVTPVQNDYLTYPNVKTPDGISTTNRRVVSH